MQVSTSSHGLGACSTRCSASPRTSASSSRTWKPTASRWCAWKRPRKSRRQGTKLPAGNKKPHKKKEKPTAGKGIRAADARGPVRFTRPSRPGDRGVRPRAGGEGAAAEGATRSRRTSSTPTTPGPSACGRAAATWSQSAKRRRVVPRSGKSPPCAWRRRPSRSSRRRSTRPYHFGGRPVTVSGVRLSTARSTTRRFSLDRLI